MPNFAKKMVWWSRFKITVIKYFESVSPEYVTLQTADNYQFGTIPGPYLDSLLHYEANLMIACITVQPYLIYLLLHVSVFYQETSPLTFLYSKWIRFTLLSSDFSDIMVCMDATKMLWSAWNKFKNDHYFFSIISVFVNSYQKSICLNLWGWENIKQKLLTLYRWLTCYEVTCSVVKTFGLIDWLFWV